MTHKHESTSIAGPSDLTMMVTTGRGLGKKVSTEQMPWADLVKHISKAPVDDIRHSEYAKLTNAERAQRKSKRGYYILGELRGSDRNNDAVVSRSGVQLDVEGSNATLAQIKSVLGKWEWHAHSTRSSIEGDRRFRVVVPYTAGVADMAVHRAVSRYLCDRLEMFGIAVDTQSSTVLSQPAFLPTLSADQTFDYLFNKGEQLLDPASLAIDYETPMAAGTVDLKPKSKMSTDQIKDVLSYLTDSEVVEDYWQWIKTGQALFHQYDGSHEGLELWDDWSANGANYPGAETIENKWRSFHVAGQQTITVASLVHAAKEKGWHDAAPPAKQVHAISPQPLDLGCSSAITPRQWLLGRRLLRGYISLMSAPGGTGKSVFHLSTAIAVALGRQDVTGETVHERVKTWVINWEDDTDEIHRRIHACTQHFGIAPGDLKEWLSVDSWYGLKGRKLVVDGDKAGVVATKIAEQIAVQAKDNGIGLIVLDPLVALHTANENDNGAMDQVFSVLRQIAAHTDAAVLVANHTPKGSGKDSEAHAGSGDAGRGASAQRDAARFTHTLARMSKETAEQLGLDPEEARRMIRLDSAKLNFALPDADATWYRMETVSLLNGDEVGVPVPFDMTSVAADAARQRDAESDQQMAEWRVQIVEAMPEDRVRLRALNEHLTPVWATRRTQTNDRIRMSIPVGKERALTVQTMGGIWQLWREHGGAANSPVNVCKQAVDK